MNSSFQTTPTLESFGERGALYDIHSSKGRPRIYADQVACIEIAADLAYSILLWSLDWLIEPHIEI